MIYFVYQKYILKLTKYRFANPDPKDLKHREIYFSGYSIKIYDYLTALSSCISSYRYVLDDSAINNYT